MSQKEVWRVPHITAFNAETGLGVEATCTTKGAAGGEVESRVLVGSRKLLLKHGLALDATAEKVMARLEGEGKTTVAVVVGPMVVGLLARLVVTVALVVLALEAQSSSPAGVST